MPDWRSSYHHHVIGEVSWDYRNLIPPLTKGSCGTQGIKLAEAAVWDPTAENDGEGLGALELHLDETALPTWPILSILRNWILSSGQGLQVTDEVA